MTRHGLALASLLLLALSVRILAQEGTPPAVLPFDRDLLEGIEDRAPVRNADENVYEYRAYNGMLLRARRTEQAAFARAARHDLTYAHLFEQPGDHRGQVVHLAGRLKRLRQFDAPAAAAAEGVKILYEGWIFDDLYAANPFCVVFTELPPELKPAEQLEQRVTFDGWFFKRYRYRDAVNKLRDCPLFIGRTMVLDRTANQPESSWSFSSAFLPAFLVLIAGTGLFGILLAWWYRSSDRAVRQRLATTQEFIPPSPGNAPPPADPGNLFRLHDDPEA